ncbi:hypothetical protein COT83_02590 [Candidatus Peregrinibacteria bacterium CG10_big_fil_rev_8_21_14_0_10_44_7]|nr:MAG: hypothetical protein AUK45_01430 [Candidatus Peregrinibacteria bacterium CG2_30_44_17]PIS04092.1 MAG: hypothetical protein COT83_02590 [Candidatus Peregrinibacteria bacterium CG10_big_fil_rev_8_21_14_0_10_44_7]PIX79735.1 MAG: hypothetical protein COZ35_02605 [Candidatus Peregrinibacteria bacterium CG_4_10_14_3_um_filter_44_21]PJB89000.1 MAG: hypothetical protein CO082_02540 [Candidatus Peregrinibacteria bacterium CG_4_9_14_0_8_um_filter_44_15]
MPNPIQENSPFNVARIIIILGFFFVAYMLYNLTVSIYENYQIDTHIQTFQEKNSELESENLEKIESYQYYTSDMYVEKVAKQNLGLINPGEKVIVITEEDNNTILEAEYAESQTLAMRNSWSNPRKWLEFFLSENPFKY